MEATPGFEPGIRALQAPALPLGDVAFRGGSLVDGWARVKISPRIEETISPEQKMPGLGAGHEISFFGAGDGI